MKTRLSLYAVVMLVLLAAVVSYQSACAAPFIPFGCKIQKFKAPKGNATAVIATLPEDRNGFPSYTGYISADGKWYKIDTSKVFEVCAWFEGAKWCPSGNHLFISAQGGHGPSIYWMMDKHAGQLKKLGFSYDFGDSLDVAIARHKDTQANVAAKAAGSSASSGAGEICYASGRHLWLMKLPGGKPVQLTPNSVGSGKSHLPVWMDRNRILFLHKVGNSKEKAGILDVNSKSIKWIPALQGAETIGYDAASNKIEYVRKSSAKRPSDMAEESVQMCLGEYNCATGKSSEKPCYTTWAGIHYARIYHWPQSNMRLLPVEGSDVSDQVLVYDLNRHKKLTPKWLTDQWKERYLNQAAIFNLTPGPHGLLGVYAVGEKGDTCIINTSTNSVDHISTNGGGPITFSKDGSFMAWDEGTYIWIARVSDKRAQKLCSGYEPAWRP